MGKIVGIGACVADTLISVPCYPNEDTKLKAEEINIDKVEDIFDSLNLIVDERFEENKKSNPLLPHPDKLSFKDAVIFINGERCAKKSKKLSDGDEVWLLSPASGG